MSRVTLARPWLDFDLGEDMQVLSWAVNRPGLVQARQILWREVRNADLPPDLDVDAWLATELHGRNAAQAVTFLTSRDLRFFTQNRVVVGEVEAHAVATVGFSNAERVGHRVDRRGKDWGTINVALRLNTGLSEPALIELMSIAVEARTAAVIDARWPLPLDGATGLATGTGTDCIAVASPKGQTRYAGLHTDIGEATGRAVYDAVLDGATQWIASDRERRDNQSA